MVTKPLLIAEIGHNWVPFGWKSIIDYIYMVKNAGWDIAKFQAYDTDKIKQLGDTNYKELKEAELTYYNLMEAKSICDKIDIEFMASAFDLERVDWLEKLGVKRHKIASRCIHDVGTIERMEKTDKPIIASLANWKGDELPRYLHCEYLYCKSRRQILQDGFNHNDMAYFIEQGTGFSDHTVGNGYAKLAIDLKTKIIEKHITLDKNAAGWDMPSSADFNDMVEINEYREKL